jgi:hypothetical protein
MRIPSDESDDMAARGVADEVSAAKAARAAREQLAASFGITGRRLSRREVRDLRRVTGPGGTVVTDRGRRCAPVRRVAHTRQPRARRRTCRARARSPGRPPPGDSDPDHLVRCLARFGGRLGVEAA